MKRYGIAKFNLQKGMFGVRAACVVLRVARPAPCLLSTPVCGARLLSSISRCTFSTMADAHEEVAASGGAGAAAVSEEGGDKISKSELKRRAKAAEKEAKLAEKAAAKAAAEAANPKAAGGAGKAKAAAEEDDPSK